MKKFWNEILKVVVPMVTLTCAMLIIMLIQDNGCDVAVVPGLLILGLGSYGGVKLLELKDRLVINSRKNRENKKAELINAIAEKVIERINKELG